MKRFIALIFALLLAFSLVSCSEKAGKAPDMNPEPTVTDIETTPEQKPEITPEPKPEPKKNSENIFRLAEGEYFFSSGAGAWGTELELDDDGEFDGEYHDSEMGEFADNYPDGTVYFCDFEGRFEVARKLNDYSYSLSIANIRTENPVGTEEIRDKIRYVFSDPHGLDGEEFILYTPETPVSELSEECLGWYMLRGGLDEAGTLGTWCIYNVKNETAFYMYE